MKTVEADHDVDLRLAAGGELVGFLHDRLLAFAKRVFLEA